MGLFRIFLFPALLIIASMIIPAFVDFQNPVIEKVLWPWGAVVGVLWGAFIFWQYKKGDNGEQ